MKTKTIPFDIELAKKIQSGEIEGKIVRNGHEVIILDYNSKKYSGYPIRIVYLDNDEVDYVAHEGLHIEVLDNEPMFNVGDTVSINIINSFYDADFRARYHSKLATVLFINKYGAGVKTIISGDENYFSFDELTFVRREVKEPQFKPFDKVLVRSKDDTNNKWFPAIYAYYDNVVSHITIDHRMYDKEDCIPYEGNEHLVGTTNKPKEE